MNVWLDDERPMPADYDVHVKTAQEAIALLQTGNVSKISLDHDLGTHCTGYTVAKWIEEQAANGTLKKLHLRVHTQNVVGRKNICAALQNAERYWNEIS
jgi:hypothetical protein